MPYSLITIAGSIPSSACALTKTSSARSGIRCERCVDRLAAALSSHDGLEAASTNLMGQVTLSWDEARTDRDALIAAMAQHGFHEAVT